MRRAITAAAAAAMLAVSACSGGGEGGNSASSGAEATHQEGEPANLTIDPANQAVPVTLPSPTAIAVIPPAFRGRWGMVDQDCDPARADGAKGLMVVAGDRLTFYESRGQASAIRRLDDGRIGFALAMSGEGQQWSEPTTLTLRQGGRSLLREASGSRDRAGSFTYQKCPA